MYNGIDIQRYRTACSSTSATARATTATASGFVGSKPEELYKYILYSISNSAPIQFRSMPTIMAATFHCFQRLLRNQQINSLLLSPSSVLYLPHVPVVLPGPLSEKHMGYTSQARCRTCISPKQKLNGLVHETAVAFILMRQVRPPVTSIPVLPNTLAPPASQLNPAIMTLIEEHTAASFTILWDLIFQTENRYQWCVNSLVQYIVR